MKTIIFLLALLAFSSARFNSESFYKGFSNQLNLNSQERAEVEACGNELAETVHKIQSQNKQTLQLYALNFLMASDAKHREMILSISQYLQTSLPRCREVFHYLVSDLEKGHRSPDEHNIRDQDLVNYRLHKHGSVLISSLVRLYDDLKNEHDQKAGETFAFILEVLSGHKHPHTVVDYARNYTQVPEVSVNGDDRFGSLAINQALKELGCKGHVTEDQVRNLRESIQGFFIAHLSIQSQLHRAQSISEKEVIILGAVRDLVKLGTIISENFKTLLAPHLHDLQMSHGEAKHLLKKVLHNYYLHLPCLEHKGVDLVMGIRDHHPIQTGHALASMIKLVYGSDELKKRTY